MSICVAAGAKVVVLAASAFTLSWTHSVERTVWAEDWRQAGDSLVLAEARVKGSGAGMDPQPGARLVDGWWRWKPDLAAQPALTLAASGATPRGWKLCPEGSETCMDVGADAGEPVRISSCR